MNTILDIVPTAQAGIHHDFSGSAVVVIDVLRATTSMLQIFESGGSAIYPVGEVERARERKRQMPRALLCGERKGVPPEGFDMGNSPVVFRDAELTGREIILTTTNGTQAVESARTADLITTASFGNTVSVARYLRRHASNLPVYLLCAGTNGAFSIEDYFCAGIIASYLLAADNTTLTDFAWAGVKLSGLPVEEVVNAETCKHLAFLLHNGFSDDVELCLKREAENQNHLVPVYDSSKGCFIPLSV
jgi:2-phosphosulfolactate phosphatase